MMLRQTQVTFIQRCVVIVVDGYFKLDVLLSVSPHSIFDIHLAIRDRFKYLICSYSPRDPPSLKYSPFARTWVLPSCISSPPPLLGILFYWHLVGFHHFEKFDVTYWFFGIKQRSNVCPPHLDILFLEEIRNPYKDKPMLLGDVVNLKPRPLISKGLKV